MKKKNKILGDQWGSYNTNAGVWEKVPLLDSCYFYSQVWRLLSAFLHTSIPFCNIVYTLNILHTDILTMQNQASSNIFHMHLAKQPSLQPGSSWRSANILTRYKEAHTRNSFSRPLRKIETKIISLWIDWKRLVNPNIRIHILHTFLRTFSMISSERWRRSLILAIIGS